MFVFPCCQIQNMLRENENLPEEQFNLDVEEQKRLETMVEEEVAKVVPTHINVSATTNFFFLM